MSTTTTRQTADERREAVLEAAAREFARKGLHGASTDAIAQARRHLAAVPLPALRHEEGALPRTTERRMEETYQAFEHASRGKSGEEALQAMGEAYTELIAGPRAAAADAAVLRRLRRRRGAGGRAPRLARPRRARRARSGEPPEVVSGFFAKGMLLNVLNAMRLVEEPTPWGDRLIAGCVSREVRSRTRPFFVSL